MNANEQFIVKHYSGDERPTLKGHGFDGLEIGNNREEAQEFLDYLNAMLRQQQAEIEALKEKLNEAIDAEEWEPLAWELCADEHGEESCHDLIWDMGVIPEPWGERWQKYEDEAKRMIAMVRKCTHPVKDLEDIDINIT